MTRRASVLPRWAVEKGTVWARKCARAGTPVPTPSKTTTRSLDSRCALARDDEMRIDVLRLLFFLHNPSTRGLRCGDDLLLLLRGDDVVMGHLHGEAAAALGHGSEVGAVGEHFGHGHFSFHHGVAGFVVHALDAATPRVQIAHD